jgi:hypothetical protein
VIGGSPLPESCPDIVRVGCRRYVEIDFTTQTAPNVTLRRAAGNKSSTTHASPLTSHVSHSE